MSRVRRRLLHCGAGVLAGTAAHAQAHAQAPARRPEPALAQLAHRAWTARDGAPSGVTVLAQTRDGFLWLGGLTGLFRFDGVRFERYEPPPGQAVPSNSVNVLQAAPDGTLWVGYFVGGVSTIAHGRLVSYGARDGLPGGTVTALARDSAGTMWAATTRGLARLVGTRWHAVGPELGYPGGFAAALTVDRRGALWVTASAGVYLLARGGQRFVWRAPPLAAGEREAGSGSVRAAPDGSVWAVSLSRGLTRLTDTAGRPLPPTPYYARDRGPSRGWWGMYLDRQAHAWGTGTLGRLVRVALTAGRAASPGTSGTDTLALSPRAGTSGQTANTVLEDREGTVWVATDNGLDQFRVPKLTATAWTQPEENPAIAAADAGALWAGSSRIPLTPIGDRGATRAALPTGVTAAQRDLAGEVWVGGLSGLWHGRDGHFAPVGLPPELRRGIVVAIARDRNGTLWVSGQRRGTFRRPGAAWERYGAPAQAIAADSAGRTWLGYLDGRLVREGQGAARVYGAADGLPVGGILSIATEGPRVWAGGELGVAVLNGRDAGARFAPLVTTDGPLRGATGIVTTDDAVWVRDADGVARIPAPEVARALREPGYRARAERFDARDRVDGPGSLRGPTAVRGTDGRVWFTWFGGLGWIDPAHVRRNPVPPPVLVRALAAGGRAYPADSAITLPKRTRALGVTYTALSLAVPERVRFRYRLVGLDTAWQDAGARREAFYTNLGPAAYRFEVTAANEDGVWSVAPAALDVVIPPAFVQTDAFRVLCVVAAGGALWGLVAWRQRRLVRAVQARSDAVLAERMRVARELHDTLLSDVAGLTMRLDAAAAQAARAPHLAVAVLPELRDQARRTLDATRHAVTAMRATAGDVVPLPAQLADTARRVFADTPVRVDARHTGSPRRLTPAVEAEALRIATEALVNARAHAGCRAVTVTCGYERGWLAVTVRDDGRGFDPARNGTDGGRNGHWGLVGMRERAAAIGGVVAITSAPGRGTTVRLHVPARDEVGAATRG